MEEYEIYSLLNNGFSILLSSLLIFSVKGTIVWVYAGAATAHVFTAEISQMWSMLLSSLLFFVILLLFLGSDQQPYRHAQNFIGYLVYVIGGFFYAVLVVVDCSQSHPVLCHYLYPVSSSPVIEAVIWLVLFTVHLMTTTYGVISLAFVRKYLRTALSFGGVFYASTMVTILFFVQAYGALDSCPNDTVLHDKLESGTALTFAIIGCAAILVYTGPSLLGVRDPHNAVTWDDLMDSDRDTEKQDTVFLQMSLAVATLLSLIGNAFCMVYGIYTISTGIASFAIVAVGAAAPVLRWLVHSSHHPSHERPSEGLTAPISNMARESALANFSSALTWGDNRRWPHLHKHV
eukprot:144009-Rhodomonas_salina.4